MQDKFFRRSLDIGFKFKKWKLKRVFKTVKYADGTKLLLPKNFCCVFDQKLEAPRASGGRRFSSEYGPLFPGEPGFREPLLEHMHQREPRPAQQKQYYGGKRDNRPNPGFNKSHSR